MRPSGNKLVPNIFGKKSKCFLVKRGAQMGAAFQLDATDNLTDLTNL